MRRRTNPLAVILVIVVVIAAVIVATIVRNILPEGLSNVKGLIFWGIIVAIGGVGSLLIGKNLNK
ncbi:MAG: hypothetical protein PUI16_07325 [Clostridia bacterium]|nr:hypothetical protein [Clostridia bacterium]MDY5555586.1 hypothetical protein [Blautia sp.]